MNAKSTSFGFLPLGPAGSPATWAFIYDVLGVYGVTLTGPQLANGKRCLICLTSRTHSRALDPERDLARLAQEMAPEMVPDLVPDLVREPLEEAKKII